jgi:flavin-dependent dehydrogenase
MKEYDVFVAGGAIAGATAAKYVANYGFKTLLIEADKVPRAKPCSGIQFGYFEKILGEKIPRERLCVNTLKKVRLVLPNGKSIVTPFKLFNFMRFTFDEWLCRLAEEKGAEFRDGVSCKHIETTEGGSIVTLQPKNGDSEQIKAKYVIDGTGMRPKIRRILRKEEGYQERSSGATLNYYFTAQTCDLDPHTLYMFWDMNFNNMMFAWAYNKTLEDGKNYWCIGTGYDKNVKEHQELFFEHVTKKYNITGINIVKREGYSSNLAMEDANRIWLGQDNCLMVGDAAGLIDITRGVGMDAAALSGRFAARAIKQAEDNKTPGIVEYEKIMKNLVDQTRRNQSRGILNFQTNDDLMKYLKTNGINMGVGMIYHSIANKFRKVEDLKMLPS